MKKFVLAGICFAFLAACSVEHEAVKPDAKGEMGKSSITGETASKLSAEEVYERLKKEEIEAMKGKEDYFHLLGVKPTHYQVKNDHLFVYEFQREAENEKARKDFQKQTELINMLVPLEYSCKNLLILYLPEHNVPKQEIVEALKKLSANP